MLTRWQRFEFPFGFDLLDRGLDEVFEALTPVPERWPSVTLKEELAGFVLSADLPGFTDKDVEIIVENDTVVLRGARAVEPPKDHAVRLRERTSASFSRKVALPAHVDSEGVTATLKDGVLTVTLPKAKEAVSRKINVNAS